MKHGRLLVVAATLTAAPAAFAEGAWFKWLLEPLDSGRHVVEYAPLISGNGRYAFFAANSSGFPPRSCDMIRMDIRTGEMTVVGSWEWCQVMYWGMQPAPDGNSGFGNLGPKDNSQPRYLHWTAGVGGDWWDGEYPLLFQYSASGNSMFGVADQFETPPFFTSFQQLSDGRIVEYELPPNAYYFFILAIGADDSLAACGVQFPPGDPVPGALLVYRDGRLRDRIEDPRIEYAGWPQVDSETGRIAGFCTRTNDESPDMFIWDPAEGVRLIGLREGRIDPFGISVDLNAALWRRWTEVVEHGVETSSALWRRGLGVSTATSILVTDYGFELGGAIGIEITDLSDDGQTVVGVARFEGFDPCGGPNFVPFAAHIPFRMPGDVDRDFAVDGADLGLLLGAWGTGDSASDFTGDGVVDGDDLGVVLAAWGNDGFE